jgi:predicted enzyme related to lactoylglutathione lyase
MDKVVHFEVPAEDLARAKSFYGDVFEWQLQDMDMGNNASYTIATTTPVDDRSMPTDPGAINGGMMTRTPELSSPVITVGVPSIDDSLKKIEAAGGSVVTPRTEIPGMGAFAYFTDTEGNTLGLWETLQG